MTARVHMFGLPFDPVTLEQAVSWIRSKVSGEDRESGFGLVHTVNVDHVVLARRDKRFYEVSRGAELSLADGMPLVWAGRWLGARLPERVAGVDLVRSLGDAHGRPVGVFLLGSKPAVAERAASILDATRGIQVNGWCSPDRGELMDPHSSARIVATINASGADVVIAALGAPFQEIWLADHSSEMDCRLGIGVGATLDFLAGEISRAPAWLQGAGFEWMHRALQDPVRLGRRYFLRDPIFLWWLIHALIEYRLAGTWRKLWRNRE